MKFISGQRSRICLIGCVSTVVWGVGESSCSDLGNGCSSMKPCTCKLRENPRRRLSVLVRPGLGILGMFLFQSKACSGWHRLPSVTTMFHSKSWVSYNAGGVEFKKPCSFPVFLETTFLLPDWKNKTKQKQHFWGIPCDMNGLLECVECNDITWNPTHLSCLLSRNNEDFAEIVCLELLSAGLVSMHTTLVSLGIFTSELMTQPRQTWNGIRNGPSFRLAWWLRLASFRFLGKDTSVVLTADHSI